MVQTVMIDIDDKYTDQVLELLESLKDGMIKDIKIKDTSIANNKDLEEFYKLVKSSNNKVKLTYQNATNTDEIIDGIF